MYRTDFPESGNTALNSILCCLGWCLFFLKAVFTRLYKA